MVHGLHVLMALVQMGLAVMTESEYRVDSLARRAMAPVSEDDKTFGYIDKTEKVVIPFKFKKAYPFEHGKARVQDEDGNWRKIDKTGKFID